MRHSVRILAVSLVVLSPFAARAQESASSSAPADGTSDSAAVMTATGPLPTAPIPLPVLAPGCPFSNLLRTPAQVWADHLDAMQKGDLDRAMCDYAWDARVILPGSVNRGHAQIRAGLEGMGQLFGGTLPTVESLTIDGEVILLTYSLHTPFASIPDGSDTYVVRFGLIHYQAVHASVVFGSP